MCFEKKINQPSSVEKCKFKLRNVSRKDQRKNANNEDLKQFYDNFRETQEIIKEKKIVTIAQG